jgi:hypothetical protein
MYGKWVTVNLGEDIQCQVWVTCVPSTTAGELQHRAMGTLKSRIPEKKTGIMRLGDTLQTISDYEYLRYEMEQKLKDITLEDAEKSFHTNQS